MSAESRLSLIDQRAALPCDPPRCDLQNFLQVKSGNEVLEDLRIEHILRIGHSQRALEQLVKETRPI